MGKVQIREYIEKRMRSWLEGCVSEGTKDEKKIRTPQNWADNPTEQNKPSHHVNLRPPLRHETKSVCGRHARV